MSRKSYLFLFFLVALASVGFTLSYPTKSHSHSKITVDGNWLFESANRKGHVSYLPKGDTVLLNIRGQAGEVTITPGNPGLVESLIKNLCTKLYGRGKINYNHAKKKALFQVAQITGDAQQKFCPAAKLLGELAGKDVARQLENHSLKLDFSYKTTEDQLILSTVYKKEPVMLTFKKQ